MVEFVLSSAQSCTFAAELLLQVPDGMTLKSPGSLLFKALDLLDA
jgi:hypothetical protein